MMFRYLLPLSCLLLLALTGCNTELPLPGAASERKVVLFGELTAGDTMLIRAGQSTPLAQGSIATLVQGLQVSAKDGSGSLFSLNGSEDSRSFELYTLPFSSPIKVSGGSVYELTAKHADLGSASATVSIPHPFTVAFGPISVLSYRNDSVRRIDIDISDNNAANSYYVIEALNQTAYTSTYFRHNGSEYSLSMYGWLYDSLIMAGVTVPRRTDTTYSGTYGRQSMYGTDPLNDNAYAGADKQFERIFLHGKTFGGNSHRTQVLVPCVYPFELPDQLMQTVVYVKSVSKEYYDFLKAYQQYNASLGYGSNVIPSNLPGNVKGGFGMVGGVQRWQKVFFY